MRQIVLFLLLWPASTLAHGPRPEVIGLTLSETPGGGVHALTNNQGVFAALNFNYKWICEDAIYPLARTQGLALLGLHELRWLVATNHGLHVSVDDGCDFQAVDHALGIERLSGLWKNPLTQGVVTATATPDEPSILFESIDEGRTWTRLPLEAAGVVKDIQWVPTVPERMLVHSDAGLYLREMAGRDFQILEVRTAEQLIPTDFVRAIMVSPVSPERMLALANAGERTRILLSTDLGLTWRDVALLDEVDVSGLFDSTGEQVMAVGLLGGRWRSQDAGETWQVEPAGPPTVGCLMRGRGDSVYACANPNADGPFVIGRTRDFGRTWTPILARFEDTAHRKDCATGDRTVQCCRGRCPGDETMCGQPLNPEWPPECYEIPVMIPDQGVADGGAGQSRVDAEMSVTADAGMGASIDATRTMPSDMVMTDASRSRPMENTERRTGCQSMPGPHKPAHTVWLFLGLGLYLARSYVPLRPRHVCEPMVGEHR